MTFTNLDKNLFCKYSNTEGLSVLQNNQLYMIKFCKFLSLSFLWIWQMKLKFVFIFFEHVNPQNVETTINISLSTPCFAEKRKRNTLDWLKDIIFTSISTVYIKLKKRNTWNCIIIDGNVHISKPFLVWKNCKLYYL